MASFWSSIASSARGRRQAAPTGRQNTACPGRSPRVQLTGAGELIERGRVVPRHEEDRTGRELSLDHVRIRLDGAPVFDAEGAEANVAGGRQGFHPSTLVPGRPSIAPGGAFDAAAGGTAPNAAGVERHRRRHGGELDP